MTPAIPPYEDPELLSRALARTGDCPPLERLAAAALGELPERERAEVLAHAGSCPACGAELALAASFAEEGVDSSAVDEVVERLRAAAPAGPGRVIAFPDAARRERARAAGERRAAPAWTRWAAAALVVLGLGLLWQALRPALPPELAGPGGIDVVRGGEIAAVAPVGEIAGVPAELAWQAVSGAARYRIELFDVAGESLGGGESASATFALPAGVAGRLHVRSSYAWQVIAFAADGRELARSERVEISILPAAH